MAVPSLTHLPQRSEEKRKGKEKASDPEAGRGEEPRGKQGPELSTKHKGEKIGHKKNVKTDSN